MTSFDYRRFQRRQFLATAAGFLTGAVGARLARADDLPKNTNPRAIFGDWVEPDWDQPVTITVGPKEADLVGATDRVIQAAVDYVAGRGGGTVRVLPGTYRLRNSIFLQSKVRILGSGTDSVLVKEPSVVTKLMVDGDHWDQEVALADPKGFQVGDGVRLVSKNLTERVPISSSRPRPGTFAARTIRSKALPFRSKICGRAHTHGAQGQLPLALSKEQSEFHPPGIFIPAVAG